MDLGAAVAGDDDLPAGGVQVVEGVEEALAGVLLAGDELDVVDEEDVGLAVLVAEVLDAVLPQGGDEVVGEMLGAGVEVAPALVGYGVADCVQQMGLAEAHACVDEERVVGCAGLVGDGDSGGVGEAVGLADDERRERVAGVQGRAGAAHPRVRRGRLGYGRGNRSIAQDLVADGPVCPRPALQRPDDQRRHALLETLGDEAAGDAHGELPALGAQPHGVPEPGVEVVAGYFKLEAAEDGGPYLPGRWSGWRQKGDS